MEHQGKASVIFDYTYVSRRSLQQEMGRLLEAISTISPVFNTAAKDSIEQSRTPEERLKIKR